jgi:signal transduction histidine kinase
MISDMRSSELEEHGLVAALGSAARAATSGSEVDLSFETRGEVRRLSADLETTLLRVGREAVTNAVRHARADRVRVELSFGPQSVELSVEDDGRGTSATEIERAGASGHWGIQGMRERAREAGGRLDIESRPGGGTRVTITIPLAADPPA